MGRKKGGEDACQAPPRFSKGLVLKHIVWMLKDQDGTPNLPLPGWFLGLWVPRELQWELCQCQGSSATAALWPCRTRFFLVP